MGSGESLCEALILLLAEGVDGSSVAFRLEPWNNMLRSRRQNEMVMVPDLLSSFDGAILAFVKTMDTVLSPLAPREAMKLSPSEQLM